MTNLYDKNAAYVEGIPIRHAPKSYKKRGLKFRVISRFKPHSTVPIWKYFKTLADAKEYIRSKVHEESITFTVHGEIVKQSGKRILN